METFAKAVLIVCAITAVLLVIAPIASGALLHASSGFLGAF